MGDVYCAKCSEPWDAYGVLHGDMRHNEKERFLKGEGCPSCGFGTRCSSCDGSGRDPEPPYRCNVCLDEGYVLAWSPHNYVPGYRVREMYTGYSPNVRHIPSSVYDSSKKIGVRTFPERCGGHMAADGYVTEWWVQCPEGCADEDPECTCLRCRGSGKLTVDSEEDTELEAARSEISNSDEDPFEILERRGLA